MTLKKNWIRGDIDGQAIKRKKDYGIITYDCVLCTKYNKAYKLNGIS